MVLYTNDRNLANKTLVSGIGAYDSTTIHEGIATARKELASNTKQLKTDNFAKAETVINNDVNIMEEDENEMDKTLIPDFSDEDMLVDEEMPSANIIPRVVDETDLYQLFQDVWYVIYKYTCRYALSLGIELGHDLPYPNPEELPPDLEPNKNQKHLKLLANGVVQLAKCLNDLLKIAPTSLKVNTRQLVNFHSGLTAFLPKLDQVKPISHPASPDHPPIRPGLMLNFALQPEYRERLSSGLTQLVTLRDVLQSCIRAVQRNIKSKKI